MMLIDVRQERSVFAIMRRLNVSTRCRPGDKPGPALSVVEANIRSLTLRFEMQPFLALRIG